MSKSYTSRHCIVKVLELDPHNPDSWQALGDVLDDDEAISAVRNSKHEHIYEQQDCMPRYGVWPRHCYLQPMSLSLIHISEPTRLLSISYAVFCLKKKKTLILHNT
eukprot:TRINITY_DN19233_c0_g1_i3.p2 TRINITY_DN19233_c0_g1~~TRINITY_DN19233_c0_g1_i3.p2  ORF type:complete len:106 (-),score=6.44 TRINITY_DN19233_c0_g1_i3:15-332(-)